MAFVQSTAYPLESTFSEYHREFLFALKKCQQAIESSSQQEPAQAAQLLSNADSDITEAADLLKSLELESQSQDLKTRNGLRPYVTEGRNALSDARKALRAARVSVSQRKDHEKRDQLLQPGDVRIDMADGTSQLEKSGEILSNSRRHIAETELIGASILEDLQSQRNTIIRARQNLGNVSTGLEQSNSILNTMHRRAVVNRILVYVVFAAIAISCVAVIYMRLFHGHSQKR